VVTEKTLNQRHSDLEAVFHFKQCVADGKNWYIALLEAISLWGSAEETYNGQFYRYLIAGEAFDWLSLAQRLCLEVDGLLPDEERDSLLLSAIPPVDLSQREFRTLIGEAKYRAYLNYVYGIVVEEALVAAVADEVHREVGSLGIHHPDKIEHEAYRRVYDLEFEVLLRQFLAESGRVASESISLTEEKEFTYWLFKRRVDACEKARVASDTKKALEWLQRQWASVARKRAQIAHRETPD
jgi:hypothetical protein